LENYSGDYLEVKVIGTIPLFQGNGSFLFLGRLIIFRGGWN